jgi:lipoate-protein ligase A
LTAGSAFCNTLKKHKAGRGFPRPVFHCDTGSSAATNLKLDFSAGLRYDPDRITRKRFPPEDCCMLTVINLYTTDAAFNLAAEQHVFENLPRDRDYLMLWQNANAVIIGKYQNTLAEINTTYIEEHHIQVIRRLSGGGAVYHDLGNLNYTFITDARENEGVNLRSFCEPVVQALRSLGVPAEINGRNDITVEEKKISGNAQYLRNGRVMHHGTLLFDSDLSVVGEALRVDPQKISAKGIHSVRSRVTNIRPYLREDIPISAFWERLKSEMCADRESCAYLLTEEDQRAIRAIQKERYDTWEWNYGRSPVCTLSRSGRIEGCGKIEAYITLEHGVIIGIAFRGDYFSAHDPEELVPCFIGKRPDVEGFRDALQGVNAGDYFTGLTTESLLTLLAE